MFRFRKGELKLYKSMNEKEIAEYVKKFPENKNYVQKFLEQYEYIWTKKIWKKI